MENNIFDLIIGYHSIYHALLNEDRKIDQFIATQKGIDEFRRKYNDVRLPKNINVYKTHEFQEVAKKYYMELGVNFSRITSGILLKAESLSFKSNAWLYDTVEKKDKINLLALDQITDVHNAAAIIRTAAFYEVDAVIVSTKGSFKLTPNFFRISSGGYEYTPFVQVPSLSKTLNKLKDLGATIIGFSEESEESDASFGQKNCFVLGAEDTGISNAVERKLDYNICLETSSPLNSLNVSVATAVALERCLK